MQPHFERPEPHLAVLQDVGRILANAASGDAALAQIVECLCTALHWEYGACWNEDEQTRHVVCTQIWHQPALADSEFIELTRNASFEPGAGGLIRSTLESRGPFAVEDISALPGMRRAPAALAAGLRSAFAFPLVVGGQPLGVMEFFCRESRTPDEALTSTGIVLGRMVGESLARRQAEGRYRELVELSPDAIARDAKRRAAESALRKNERALSTLLGNIPGMAYRCRLDDLLTLEFASEGCIQLTGHRPIDLIDNRVLSFVDLVYPGDRIRVQNEIREKLQRSDHFIIEYQIVCADAGVKWVSEKAQALRNGDGAIIALEGILDDITDRKRFEERLSFLAQYDMLTGLPNRALFYDRLRQAVGRARREQWMVGLMFLDLDRFKQINDTLGQAAGDRVLKVVAERLKGFLREVDTIARLGGDEFTVVIEGVSEPEQLSGVAEKIRNALADPVDAAGRDLSGLAS